MPLPQKPLSDQLLEALDGMDDVGRAKFQTLFRPVAAELRIVEARPAAAIEHVPVYLYHLLRGLAEGPISLSSLHAAEDKGAVAFLVSRGWRPSMVMTWSLPSPAGRSA